MRFTSQSATTKLDESQKRKNDRLTHSNLPQTHLSFRRGTAAALGVVPLQSAAVTRSCDGQNACSGLWLRGFESAQ